MCVYIHESVYVLVLKLIISRVELKLSTTDLRLLVRGALRLFIHSAIPPLLVIWKGYVHILKTELTSIAHNLFSNELYILSCKENCITSNQHTILGHLHIALGNHARPWRAPRGGRTVFCGKALGSGREEVQISSQTVKEEFKATINSQVPISGEKWS